MITKTKEKTTIANQKKTHKVWARIGITIHVTEEEYNRFKKIATEELNEEDAEFFRKNGYVDGESYIPEEVFEYDNQID